MKFGICGGPGTNILVDIKGQLEAERTPCLKGDSDEELPHVRGQDSGREWQAATAQEGPRGGTLHPRSGPAMKGTTPHPRS